MAALNAGGAADHRPPVRRRAPSTSPPSGRTSTRWASPYRLEPGLVRGLDYYTRTAFEFYVAGREGQQQALGGGGRYDGLVELLGGRPTPGIGFGLGLDRVLLALEAEQGVAAPPPTPPRSRSSSAPIRPTPSTRLADRHRPAGGRARGAGRARPAQARQAARGGRARRRPLRGHPRRRAGRRATSSSATCRPARRRSSRWRTSPASSPRAHGRTGTGPGRADLADQDGPTADELELR